MKPKISVIIALTLLAGGATAQTGLTLFDSDLQAQGNDIRGLSTLNPGNTQLRINASTTNLTQNNITDPAFINNFFDQDQCASDEAIKTVLPNGSYVCNSISTTTEAENLSETLAAGNVAGEININLSGNNLTEINTLNSNGTELRIGSNITVGDGETSIAELNRLTDLPLQPTVDGFEDGDLTEYVVKTSISTESSSVEIQSEEVKVGDSALNISTSSGSFGSSAKTLLSNSSLQPVLSSRPERGQSFELYTRIEGSTRSRFFFGLQSYDARSSFESYAVELDPETSEIRFLKESILSSKTISLPKNEWLRVNVKWGSSGTILTQVYDSNGNELVNLTVSDSEYNKGDIGYRASTTSTSTQGSVYFDDFQITDAGGIEIDSDLQLEDSRLSDVRSIDGGGDSVNFNDNLNLQNQNISNFFDQNQCADDEAIKTVLPNGSYVCNSISTTTEAEGLPETLETNNTANQSIDFDGNNVDNLSELNPFGGNLLLGSNLTLGGKGAFARVNRITSKPVSPIYDSWDDGDIEEYGNATPTGITVDATQVTSDVQEGSGATEITANSFFGSSTQAFIYQQGPEGPERGDRFQGYVKAGSSGSSEIVFGAQENSVDADGYELDFDYNEGNISIAEELGSTETNLASSNVDIVRQNWYRYVIDWRNNGTITAEIYNVSSSSEVAEISATDTRYSSGYWGVFNDAGVDTDAIATYDGFEILSSEDVDFDANVDFENNSLSDINSIQGFFNQDKCGPNEAIKTVYPNGSYACNSISTTTEAENLSETLSAGNSAGDNNINLSGNNLTEVDTLNSNGSELRIGGNVTVGDGSSIAEVNRLTDLPLQPTVDSFEDGDMSEYSTDISAASSSSSEIQASVTQDGAQALNLTAKGLTDPVSTAGARSEVSLNGLDQYPERGDVFQFYLHPEITQLGNEGVQVSFARNEAGLGQGRGYEFQHDENGFSINKGVGISPSKSDSMSNTFQEDTFYRVRVNWSQNGEISATLFNADTSTKVGTVSITDSDYDTGGVGYSIQSNPGQRASEIFDGFQIIDSGGIEVDSDVQLEDSRLSDVRSIDGDGDAVNVDDNLDLNGNNISGVTAINNFFDQSQCASDEAIKTVLPNGSYVCNSISTTTSAENLSETLNAGNTAGNNNINLSGNNLTNVDTVKGSSPVSFADNVNLTQNNITDVGNIEFKDAGGNILNVNKLSLSQGSSDFRLRVGGKKFLDEDFEDNSISPFQNDPDNDEPEFAFQSQVPWVTTSNTPFGDHAAQATDTGDDEVAEMEKTVSGGDLVVFKYHLDSDTSTFDEAYVETGSGRQEKLTNTNGGWVTRSLEVSPGSTQLEFVLRGGDGGSIGNTDFRVDDVRVFSTTENAMTVYGSQSLNTGDLNQVDRINFVEGLEVGQGSNATRLDATAVGRNSKASDSNTVALGSNSSASLSGAVALGGDSDASSSDAMAFGRSSSASNNGAVALGRSSSASGNDAMAFGRLSSASEDGAKTLGRSSSASGNDAMAFGRSSSASEDGAVALGSFANAPNPREATFGALDTDPFGISNRLDVNVTGNLTVHQNTDLKGNLNINNSKRITFSNNPQIGKNSKATGEDATALGQDSKATGTNSTALGPSSTASARNAVTLGQASEASTQNSLTLGYHAGDNSVEGQNAVLIGPDPGGFGPGQIATGDNSIGLGANVTATAPGAVAIGNNAKAPNSYEATFGNLNGEELDVNVTGNATIHGSNGLDLNGNALRDVGAVYDDSGSQCGTNEFLNGEGDCQSASTSSQEAENLSETLSAGNKAGDNNINLSGNNITDARKIEFQDAGGDILNVDQLSLSEGSSDFRLRVGGEKFLDEGFEDGSLSPFENLSTNNENWTLTTDTKFGGFAATSPPTTASESDVMRVDVSGGTVVTFRYRTVNGDGLDRAFFEVDQRKILLDPTEGEWRLARIAVKPGPKTLEWNSTRISFGSLDNQVFSVDSVKVFNETESAVSVFGTQTMNGGDLTAVDGIETVRGVEIGNGAVASDRSVALGRGANASSGGVAIAGSSTNEGGIAINGRSTASGSIALGGRADGPSSIAIGDNADANAEDSIAINADVNQKNTAKIGRDTDLKVTRDLNVSDDSAFGDTITINTSGSDFDIVGKNFNDFAQDLKIKAPNEPFTSGTAGDLVLEGGSDAFGVVGSIIINGGSLRLKETPIQGGDGSNNAQTVEIQPSIAVGTNSIQNLQNGDINASTVFYDETVAKSPVVQCSQGSSWCSVSVPENQSSFFVKKGEDFNKDRPRITADEVVESDVETIEKFEELRRENQRQEERIEDLNTTVQSLKSVVCEDSPDVEVCQ